MNSPLRKALHIAREWLGWFTWFVGANIVVGLLPWFHDTLIHHVIDAVFTATAIVIGVGFYRWVKRSAAEEQP